MEDRRLPITIGQGAGAKVVTLDLPPFTLIGATTRAGLLSTPAARPLRHPATASSLRREDLARIVPPLGSDPRSSPRRRRSLGDRTALARNPRVANRLLKRVRDWAEVRGTGMVDDAAADARLALLEVDELGLDRLDREILGAICEQFGGGPVGLSDACVAVNEEPDTIEDVYEPYLLQTGAAAAHARGARGDAARLRAPRARAAGDSRCSRRRGASPSGSRRCASREICTPVGLPE
jgi:Holliday junction DNA helicase RuvB